jgi:hypothetical protein
MAKTDVMIDLETLATSSDAAILTIGAVKFDPFGREKQQADMDSFYVRVDLDSCHEIGLVTNDDTIAWWASQSKEAQAAAFDPEDRLDIEEAFARLYKFLTRSFYFWLRQLDDHDCDNTCRDRSGSAVSRTTLNMTVKLP